MTAELERLFRVYFEYYEGRAVGLLASAQAGTESALARFGRWGAPLAAENDHVDAIRALLDAGADPTIHDARHDHTPAGWAEHGGRKAALELLRAA